MAIPARFPISNPHTVSNLHTVRRNLTTATTAPLALPANRKVRALVDQVRMVSVDWARHWLVALAVDSSHMKLAVACSERSQEQLLARSEQTLQSTSTRSTSTDTTMSIIITMGTIIKLSMIELYRPWQRH
jgi:hypothetical protein